METAARAVVLVTGEEYVVHVKCWYSEEVAEMAITVPKGTLCDLCCEEII